MDIAYDNFVNSLYSFLKKKYPAIQITDERKAELANKLEKYGYLPYSYMQALQELSNAEVLFCLEKKWEHEGVFSDGIFNYTETSTLARNNVNNTYWIKREGHNIKLINLAGLGNGNTNQQNVSFMDWLRQIVILPTGNKNNNIYNTTIYLTPFHPRAFGCAYIPNASCVSSFLEDKDLLKDTGINADTQVKIFIKMAQLAGHPVIYDILPQTGRFSKTVLANPACVRWFDINFLISEICSMLDNSREKVLSDELLNKYPKKILDDAIAIYKNFIRGERKFSTTEQIKEAVISIDKDKTLLNYKKLISDNMQNKNNQIKIQHKAKNIIKSCLSLNTETITEKDITDRDKTELELIKQGLWPLPGGAWNSAGVPAFDKMAKNALYPMMKHYNFRDEDVTKYANLDCQSPFYFVFLETGEYNEEVINFYISYVKNLVKEFNFDGIRIDHVNHVVDELSEQNGLPVSYRIPKLVLTRLNNELKSISPHFAIIAEYMLNNDYIKEYHQDMNFDILYGNDILFQCYKTPETIDIDNQYIAKYNRTLKNIPPVSVLKTYNNQDGEYRQINMYPGQLGREGALFKWFKYKFLPGGFYAPRPVLYVDGDESFSIGGIEAAICNETFMKRNNDKEFFAKFDAIDRFAKNNSIICYGEAHILQQDEDGFVYWQIQTNDINNFMIVVANYNSPTELFPKNNNTNNGMITKTGKEVTDKTAKLLPDYKFVSEFKFNGTDYVEEKLDTQENFMHFDVLSPAEFKFYRVIRNI